ncbi:Asp-tRNA(Asn)/Glu-tRNA(Gln) amidotransferase subunit GatA [Latilactobacillus curvatus]|uniref:Asp-tRNA(Asn)/Glu-tRNA(Gln) amidotransferase subunit GatA n=1 Tax=Latilactobacillus curvatus TaxID=28038 RepID=UPI000DAAE548|nr:Asp-tRNA(Asn)/Glu-tRNA(Gln) amidotransferase subunit GatA [Latilactobacillus curvatus]AWV72412.1 Asp-tRNA(Asn)/Glu-tRNA(Gln) amidotransferase GatCAB subunit A [Latilactobacillus curvatus]AZP96921.1 Asp-tRNA(Asn)/Glu-tRNA(Gln) amidotransferase GatCAB subunit A [Latilactobacillus curvatus]MCP8878183.1 Asp-tRNA(Asn)/Glu-tRNA(Gln) amidotransferase subunit GatA [Latilactobacillus curvatus]
MNYLYEDLQSIHAKLVAGDLTASQLVTETVAEIDKREPQVDAFLAIDEAGAQAAAAKVDAQPIDADNLLAGMPIGIKDNLLTDGLTTTAASKMLENFTPVFDATVVEKLKAKDAIVIGKNNMDEFAMGSSTETSAFKKTKNPWNLDKVPGGSSGGSAAAVAAGEVIASLGTDTGGSIRQPAAFNGIVGIKPTYGRVSRWGAIAFASSLDQVGVFSRTVADNATVLQAISGHDEKDSTSADIPVPDFRAALNGDIKGMKIAVAKEYMAEGVEPGVKAQIETAIETLKSLGATVDEVSLPNSKYAVQTYYIMASSEASSNLSRFDGIRYGYRSPEAKTLEDVYVKSRSEGFGDEVKRRIMLGTFALSSGFYDAYFKKAGQVRTLIVRDFEKVFADYDLVVGPTTPTTAFDLGRKVSDPVTMYMNDILTIPANMAGLPAMSVPAGLVDGMPVGLQIIGKAFDEESVYRAGYAFEQATQFNKNVPSFKGGKA